MRISDWSSDVCSSDLLTCGAIIRETLGWGLDEDDDRKDIWMEDARASIGRGKYEKDRAIYAYALRVFVKIGRAARRERLSKYELFSVDGVSLKHKMTETTRKTVYRPKITNKAT